MDTSQGPPGAGADAEEADAEEADAEEADAEEAGGDVEGAATQTADTGGAAGASDRREGPILLFDGVCNLCTGLVQFVVERDPEGRFRFASLQSEAGRALLQRHGLPVDEVDTFVLVEDGTAYTKSTGALRVARELGLPWSLLWPVRFVPRPLRDAAYDLVAATRYDVFGRKDRCMIPDEDVSDRFLDA